MHIPLGASSTQVMFALTWFMQMHACM